MNKTQNDKLKEIMAKEQSNCAIYENYGSSDLCSLSIFESANNDNDKNIVVKIVSITGISDNFEPYVSVSNIVIEPNGHSFDLASVYKNQDVMDYLETLKKIK